MIQYKKATENDISLIYDLAHKIWTEHYIPIIGKKQVDYMLDEMYSEKALLEQMNNGHQFTIILKDRLPIGYYSISKNENMAMLQKIYFMPGLQGKGFGTEVMKQIYSECTDCIAIRLTVNRQNFKAINFYFKNGFKIKSVEDFDIGNGYFMNDFVMEKRLI